MSPSSLLTLTLISGVLFSETLFGKALTFNHKTLFAFLSWLIFAALLDGPPPARAGAGALALRWTLAGFVDAAAGLRRQPLRARVVLSSVILGR
jgi:ABC-type uncharacterized transport system permease subunit